MSDAEIERLVNFLAGVARERVDDDAPITPESMQTIRDVATVAHMKWKAKSERTISIVLPGLNVGGVNVDLDESYEPDDLDEIFSGTLDARAPPDEKRWQEKEDESARRTEERRKSSLTTWIVFAVLAVIAVVVFLQMRAHYLEEHEPTHHKSETQH